MKKLFIALSILLYGCTSLTPNMQLVTEGKPQSEILIYRDWAFHNGGVGLFVGVGDQYFVKLGNDDYVIANIDSGSYVFQAKAHASPPSELEIELASNTRVCLQGKPNSAALGAALMPIVATMIPAFKLHVVNCPDNEFFEKYELVKIP